MYYDRCGEMWLKNRAPNITFLSANFYNQAIIASLLSKKFFFKHITQTYPHGSLLSPTYLNTTPSTINFGRYLSPFLKISTMEQKLFLINIARLFSISFGEKLSKLPMVVIRKQSDFSSYFRDREEDEVLKLGMQGTSQRFLRFHLVKALRNYFCLMTFPNMILQLLVLGQSNILKYLNFKFLISLNTHANCVCVPFPPRQQLLSPGFPNLNITILSLSNFQFSSLELFSLTAQSLRMLSLRMAILLMREEIWVLTYLIYQGEVPNMRILFLLAGWMSMRLNVRLGNIEKIYLRNNRYSTSRCLFYTQCQYFMLVYFQMQALFIYYYWLRWERLLTSSYQQKAVWLTLQGQVVGQSQSEIRSQPQSDQMALAYHYQSNDWEGWGWEGGSFTSLDFFYFLVWIYDRSGFTRLLLFSSIGSSFGGSFFVSVSDFFSFSSIWLCYVAVFSSLSESL